MEGLKLELLSVAERNIQDEWCRHAEERRAVASCCCVVLSRCPIGLVCGLLLHLLTSLGVVGTT